MLFCMNCQYLWESYDFLGGAGGVPFFLSVTVNVQENKQWVS